MSEKETGTVVERSLSTVSEGKIFELPPDVKEIRLFIRGEINDADFKTLHRCKPKKKLCIFISGAFCDTYRERSLLHEEILPELQRKARKDEFQIILHDFHFDRHEDNLTDPTTRILTEDALKQCADESDGVYFLSLLGDKYGPGFLPTFFDKLYLDKAIANTPDPAKWSQISQDWYRLDENRVVIERYELKDFHKLLQDEATIRERLDGKKFDAEYPELVANRSITEWETVLAKILNTNNKRCLWVRRDFDLQSISEFESPEELALLNDFIDPQQTTPTETEAGDTTTNSSSLKLQQLKEILSSYCDVIHPLPLQKLSIKHYLENAPQNQEYLQKWRITVTNRLQEELDECIQREKVWRDTLSIQCGLPAPYLYDIFHHHSIAYHKAASFVGRENLLSEALEKIAGSSDLPIRKGPYTAITAAIIGKSGSGTTALISKLASIIYTKPEYEGIPVISRFCGKSRLSVDGIDLIHGITLQLLSIYDQREEITRLLEIFPTQSYERAVKNFKSVLMEYPVILFIDSLHQLSNLHEARGKLSFLKNLKVHDKTKIIVSTLPDEREAGMTGKELIKKRYLCEKVLRENEVPVIEMSSNTTMDKEQIRVLVEQLLFQRHRKITEQQWEVVLQSASVEPTIFYLHLALEVITKWRSWETNVVLQPTVKGLIHQLFEDIENQYGQQLVSYAFGFISFSRRGIMDSEFRDCLAREESVIIEVGQRYHRQTDKIAPFHIWLRIKLLMRNLFAENDHAYVHFYHRQIWETAQMRYYPVKKRCHAIMGKYFSEQPICLKELEVWHPDSVINRRRVKEAYYHMIESELYEAAMMEICSLEMICAAALVEDLGPMLLTLADLLKHTELFSDNLRLDHYFRWIRKEINHINVNPRMFVPSSASAEPWNSVVQQDSRIIKQRAMVAQPNTSYSIHDKIWIETLNGSREYSRLIMNLFGHTSRATAVAYSRNGDRIATGSYDNTVRIWHAWTGQLLLTLEGHHLSITSVMWNQDNTRLVSGSRDGEMKIWDALTGELLQTIEGKGREIVAIAWNKECNKIVSGNYDKKIKIWDSTTGELLTTMEGHDDLVTDVIWDPQGKRVASTAYDAKIKIWDVETAALLLTLEGHQYSVFSIAWNYDGTRIVSGSQDSTVKLWDTTTGQVANTLNGHASAVRSVMWNSDGSKIASGSLDKTIKIWNPVTAEVLLTFKVHDCSIFAMCWNPDDTRIASVLDQKIVRIWDVASTESREKFTGHEKGITSITMNPKGIEIASGSLDHTVKIWNSHTTELLHTLAEHLKPVTVVTWNPDGVRIASGSEDEIIIIWDATNGHVVRQLEGHIGAITAIAWNPDGSFLASAAADKTINIWDPIVGKLLHCLQDHDLALSLAWNHKGDKIAAGLKDSTLKIWDSTTHELLMTCEGHGGRVLSVSWSPDDSKLCSGSQDSTVKIWNMIDGKLIRRLEGHHDVVTSVSWNPIHAQIVSGSGDKTVKLWDATTGALVNTFEGHIDSVAGVTWDQKGNHIASGSGDRTIKLYYSF